MKNDKSETILLQLASGYYLYNEFPDGWDSLYRDEQIAFIEKASRKEFRERWSAIEIEKMIYNRMYEAFRKINATENREEQKEINVDIACPKCNGSTFDENNEGDCSTCLGSGDLGIAIYLHVEQAYKEGCKFKSPIVQLIAKHIIKEKKL